MRLNMNDYGNPQALTPADLPQGTDTAVLTIAKVGEYKNQQRGGAKQVGVHFAEFPDKTWYTNITILRVLVGKLGDDTASWIGKKIPVEITRVPNPQNGELVEKLYPVNPSEWDSVVADSQKATTTGGGRRTRK